jgi:hypothetical protein
VLQQQALETSLGDSLVVALPPEGTRYHHCPRVQESARLARHALLAQYAASSPDSVQSGLAVAGHYESGKTRTMWISKLSLCDIARFGRESPGTPLEALRSAFRSALPGQTDGRGRLEPRSMVLPSADVPLRSSQT